MMPRKWDKGQLTKAVESSYSIRQVLRKLNLREAGGNYTQIKKYIKHYRIDVSHFKGQGWKRGLFGLDKPQFSLHDILQKNSSFQSYKLKKRLFAAGLKQPKCEFCGWAERSADGRIPVELDHINGDARDNRLSNLRILCPNCHSLQLSHRGKNIGKHN